jgi:hypothetical protein
MQSFTGADARGQGGSAFPVIFAQRHGYVVHEGTRECYQRTRSAIYQVYGRDNCIRARFAPMEVSGSRYFLMLVVKSP